MSDEDICGAPCADDTPCEHPAGSCPVPTHGGAEDNPNHGRDYAIDEADHEDILAAAREGLSQRGCARAAGVSWQSLDRYLDAHPDFRSSFAQARNAGEQTLIEGGLRDDDVDTSMAKFLLASSFDYKKTEKREVTGDGGGPVEVEISETIVETPHSTED